MNFARSHSLASSHHSQRLTKQISSRLPSFSLVLLSVDMFSLTRRLTERKRFLDATFKAREQEKKEKDEAGLPPIFNKRAFAAKSVVITAKAREVMATNQDRLEDCSLHLSSVDIATVRDIVEGLRLVHRGIDYVKTCVAHCMTLEHHEAFRYVQKHPHEEFMSCYFILCGTVEATYDWSDSNSTQVRD